MSCYRCRAPSTCAASTSHRSCCSALRPGEKYEPPKPRLQMERKRKTTMAISFNAAALLNGNGIDVKSIVNALLSQQSGPLVAWQNEQTDLSTQAGLLNGLNNNLTTLAASVLALANTTGPLASQSATSSQPDVLTATAT